VIGGLLLAVGAVGGIGAWALTTIGLFAGGHGGLALVAMFVPPADLLLAWIVAPLLGVAGLAACVVFLAGAALWSWADADRAAARPADSANV
jgi:hypothetical protein